MTADFSLPVNLPVFHPDKQSFHLSRRAMSTRKPSGLFPAGIQKGSRPLGSRPFLSGPAHHPDGAPPRPAARRRRRFVCPPHTAKAHTSAARSTRGTRSCHFPAPPGRLCNAGLLNAPSASYYPLFPRNSPLFPSPGKIHTQWKRIPGSPAYSPAWAHPLRQTGA